MAIDKAPVNVRIYSDGQSKSSKQGLLSSAVAVTTLLMYTGWMQVIILCLCFAWYRPVLYVLLALYSTLLFPAKPVLWGAFCRHWVFRTWREYFRFSYLFEQILSPEKRCE
jgi:hypothetical protein